MLPGIIYQKVIGMRGFRMIRTRDGLIVFERFGGDGWFTIVEESEEKRILRILAEAINVDVSYDDIVRINKIIDSDTGT